MTYILWHISSAITHEQFTRRPSTRIPTTSKFALLVERCAHTFLSSLGLCVPSLLSVLTCVVGVDRTMGRTPLSVVRLTHRYRRCHPQPLRFPKPSSPTGAYARIREAQTHCHQRRTKWQCGRCDSRAAPLAQRREHGAVAAVHVRHWRPRLWWESGNWAWRNLVPRSRE